MVLLYGNFANMRHIMSAAFKDQKNVGNIGNIISDIVGSIMTYNSKSDTMSCGTNRYLQLFETL